MNRSFTTSQEDSGNDPNRTFRQTLIRISQYLKVGATQDLLTKQFQKISADQNWDDVQFTIWVDNKQLNDEEVWEFCEGELVTLTLSLAESSGSQSTSICVPVGQIERNQVDQLRKRLSPARVDRRRTNLILIGMPGSGKSTVGKRLAGRLSRPYYDLDELIQSESGQSLEKIIHEVGFERFLDLEAEAAIKFSQQNSVLATGGSVVYRPSAMLSLQDRGTIIYLQTPIPELEKRLSDLKQRGVVLEEWQSLEELYEQREPFYESYYDLKIETAALTIDQTVDRILQQI